MWLATALAAVAPAAATERAYVRRAPLTGPVIAGPGGFVWLQGDPRGSLDVQDRRVGVQRSVLQTRVSPGRKLLGASLSADGEFVALGVSETAGFPDAPTVATRVFAGPTVGQPTPFVGPRATRFLSSTYRVALSDGQLAALGPGCAESSVTDLRTGGRLLALPEAATGFERGGNYLAWLERERVRGATFGSSVVVMDLVTSAQFRVPAAADRLNVRDLDVDARGTVAFLYNGRRGSERNATVLAWASGEQPVVRKRALSRAWWTYGLELSGGTAALLQARARGDRSRGAWCWRP